LTSSFARKVSLTRCALLHSRRLPMARLEIPLEDGESPIDVYVDDDGYVVFSDEENDYELAFSKFNWNAIVEFVEQLMRKRMS
jgi:hypothetical protein